MRSRRLSFELVRQTCRRIAVWQRKQINEMRRSFVNVDALRSRERCQFQEQHRNRYLHVTTARLVPVSVHRNFQPANNWPCFSIVIAHVQSFRCQSVVVLVLNRSNSSSTPILAHTATSVVGGANCRFGTRPRLGHWCERPERPANRRMSPRSACGNGTTSASRLDARSDTAN